MLNAAVEEVVCPGVLLHALEGTIGATSTGPQTLTP